MYKICRQYHLSRVHSCWGFSWTSKLVFTCLVPKEKYPTHRLIWWERIAHTPDACGASSKLQSVRSYTRLDQAPLIRAKASHKHFNAWLSLCLSDRPPAMHKNWMDWLIGEIHISMRLHLQNCCWACPSSLVLPSGNNNPFQLLISNNYVTCGRKEMLPITFKPTKLHKHPSDRAY